MRKFYAYITLKRIIAAILGIISSIVLLYFSYSKVSDETLTLIVLSILFLIVSFYCSFRLKDYALEVTLGGYLFVVWIVVGWDYYNGPTMGQEVFIALLVTMPALFLYCLFMVIGKLHLLKQAYNTLINWFKKEIRWK